MPAYRWACLACGEANAPEAEACGTCGYPSRPKWAVMMDCRARHVARGGMLRADAAMNAQPDLSGFDVLVRPFLLLVFGWWPRR